MNSIDYKNLPDDVSLSIITDYLIPSNWADYFRKKTKVSVVVINNFKDYSIVFPYSDISNMFTELLGLSQFFHPHVFNQKIESLKKYVFEVHYPHVYKKRISELVFKQIYCEIIGKKTNCYPEEPIILKILIDSSEKIVEEKS